MLRTCACLLVLCGSSVLLAQANSGEADKGKIIALEQQLVQMAASGSYSPEFVKDHLAPELQLISPMGHMDRDDFIKAGNKQQGSQQFDNWNVRVFGDAAVADATWRMQTGQGSSDSAKSNEVHGFVMHVWVKQDGSWKLVSSAAGPVFHP